MNLKEKVHDECLRQVDEKINTAKRMMLAANESANSDTKSSAGDKYETGREMAMHEHEKAAGQLQQAMLLKKALLGINPKNRSEAVQIGSLVDTNSGNFYISTAVGEVVFEHRPFYAISFNAPIGKLLMHKKAGEEFEFNGKKFKILKVE